METLKAFWNQMKGSRKLPTESPLSDFLKFYITRLKIFLGLVAINFVLLIIGYLVVCAPVLALLVGAASIVITFLFRFGGGSLVAIVLIAANLILSVVFIIMTAPVIALWLGTASLAIIPLVRIRGFDRAIIALIFESFG